MNMDAIKAEIREALALVEDGKQLADFWAKYFGKGGEIQKLMGGIKQVPNEEKKAYGQAVNQIKNWAQALYDEKKEETEKTEESEKKDDTSASTGKKEETDEEKENLYEFNSKAKLIYTF